MLLPLLMRLMMVVVMVMAVVVEKQPKQQNRRSSFAAECLAERPRRSAIESDADSARQCDEAKRRALQKEGRRKERVCDRKEERRWVEGTMLRRKARERERRIVKGWKERL